MRTTSYRTVIFRSFMQYLVSLLILCSSLVFSNFLFAKDSSLSKIQSARVLRVCSESGYIPLEMKTASGEWIGFDVAMMSAFAKFLGVEIKMLDTKWDGIIPSLLSGKCDAIASAMAHTPERAKAVLFSEPYYINRMLIAVLDTPQNRARYQSIRDLDDPSIRIAIKTGSSPDLFLQKQKIKSSLLRFDADTDTVSAVLNRKATAFVYDTPYVKYAAANYPNKIYILPEPLGTENDFFAVAFRKQDLELKNTFNVFLKEWKRNQEYAKAEKYYFSSNQWVTILSR